MTIIAILGIYLERIIAMSNTKHCVFNDGFALWFTGNAQSFEFDVHINEWINGESNFIDFGIRIYNTSMVSNGFLYIPFNLLLADISDLSPHLSDENVARGIFNAACKIVTDTNNPLIIIEYNNRAENIIPLRLLYPKIEKVTGGVLLQLSFADVIPTLNTEETYIRFRFPHKSLDNSFSRLKHDYKVIFESPIITDKVSYTIKVNELRSLPSEVRCLFKESSQKINKIILTLSADQEYIIEDSNCYKIRHIEENLYTNYVPKLFKCNSALAYQWIVSDKNHYNFFVRIETKKILYTSLIMYAIIVILLSLLGNLIWELLTRIPHHFNDIISTMPPSVSN